MSNIVVHGHFYQPPREDPRTGTIDKQPSAAPFHDWNERVHAEAYLANVFVDLETEGGEVVVNNFERISFNIGPTLMSWMEKFHPRTYNRIVKADHRSEERVGRGNAIAQAYHHSILPLATERDVQTEVRWGLADFRHRFGREAEGLWLPETAVNDQVLKVLIEQGVGFTILAPHQASAWRADGEQWIDVRSHPIDTRVPYRYEHPDGSGRSIALFFYDGEIARSIAFENAMASASGFIDMFTSRIDDPEHLVHTATDGETYGHHHKFGDVGLAYALFVEADRQGVTPTNYAAYLRDHPIAHQARVVPGPGTSWSCMHGIARWREDCGCSTRADEGWNQEWRAPLRAGLELVHERVTEAYETLGPRWFSDPWAARDRYIDVVLGRNSPTDLVRSEARGELSERDERDAATLLELGRSSLAMFTSCGWFFADIGDIETRQILRYAARAIELLEDLEQPSPRDEFAAKLEQAKSNDPEVGTGAEVFHRLVA